MNFAAMHCLCAELRERHQTRSLDFDTTSPTRVSTFSHAEAARLPLVASAQDRKEGGHDHFPQPSLCNSTRLITSIADDAAFPNLEPLQQETASVGTLFAPNGTSQCKISAELAHRIHLHSFINQHSHHLHYFINQHSHHLTLCISNHNHFTLNQHANHDYLQADGRRRPCHFPALRDLSYCFPYHRSKLQSTLELDLS